MVGVVECSVTGAAMAACPRSSKAGSQERPQKVAVQQPRTDRGASPFVRLNVTAAHETDYTDSDRFRGGFYLLESRTIPYGGWHFGARNVENVVMHSAYGDFDRRILMKHGLDNEKWIDPNYIGIYFSFLCASHGKVLSKMCS